MKHITTAEVIHVMDEKNKPAMTVSCGETFTVETANPGIPDAVFEKDYTKEPFPKRILTITGPIRVENAQPGDILCVHIDDIRLNAEGKMWMGQWMGILMDEVDHCYMRKTRVEDGTVIFREDVRFPIRPMIGTIGTAPAGDAVDCLYPGDHGGNMDALSACPGSTVYLPVNVEGAMLSIGDVHAAMGYGEILGTGIEIGSTVTARVELIKNRAQKHPVIETEDRFEIAVSGEDMDGLCKEAARSAIAFIMEHGDYSFDEAYALAGQTSDLKILQVVNPWRTVSMSIPKAILKKKEY